MSRGFTCSSRILLDKQDSRLRLPTFGLRVKFGAMKADTDQSVAKDDQAAIARGDSAREVPVTRGLSAQLLVPTRW